MQLVFWNCWLHFLLERASLDWSYIIFRRFRRIDLACFFAFFLWKSSWTCFKCSLYASCNDLLHASLNLVIVSKTGISENRKMFLLACSFIFQGKVWSKKYCWVLWEFKGSLSGLQQFKGSLSGLQQFMTTESPLKIMKNTFFTPFFLKIFTILSWLFGHIGKRLDKKAKVNFKIHGVTDWITNNYNMHSQLIEYNVRNIFLQKLFFEKSFI